MTEVARDTTTSSAQISQTSSYQINHSRSIRKCWVPAGRFQIRRAVPRRPPAQPRLINAATAPAAFDSIGRRYRLPPRRRWAGMRCRDVRYLADSHSADWSAPGCSSAARRPSPRVLRRQLGLCGLRPASVCRVTAIDVDGDRVRGRRRMRSRPPLAADGTSPLRYWYPPLPPRRRRMGLSWHVGTDDSTTTMFRVLRSRSATGGFGCFGGSVGDRGRRRDSPDDRWAARPAALEHRRG